MKPLYITASSIVNACGVGWKEVGNALLEGRSGLRYNDFESACELETWIGRVDGVETSPVSSPHEAYDCRMNRLVQLALEQDGFAAAVARARMRYGAARVAVFVGTSTSGILSTELAARAGDTEGGPRLSDAFYDHCHSMFAPARFVRDYLRLDGIAQAISTACSSSAKVFGAASRAIAVDFCDAVVVGGADSLALSTLHGFRSLELLSKHPCRPCDIDRDGISIGEAAGFALLERHGDAAVALVGCGESADAWHMSTPHPEGSGAASAIQAGLADAGLAAESIDYVNLHGTGTRANDAAEARAVAAALPHHPPVSSTKGLTGHALAAAGITEALVTAFALERHWIPGTAGCARVDPALPVDVVRESRAKRLLHAVSNSFGFGGNNCSLVLSACT